MAFLATDNIKIMSALRLTFDDIPLITTQMTTISIIPALVLKIQSLLTEIEELEELAKTEQANPNFALVKADVLQWEGGGSRTLGFTMILYQKILDLGRCLSLEPNVEFEESLLIKANINVGTINSFIVLGKVRN